MSFRKILCPTDFSEGSRQALRLVIEKLGPDPHLVLFHVWEPPYVYGPDAGIPGSIFIETRTLAENELAKWKGEAEQLGARGVTTVMATGAPWHEIVEHARRDAAIDLIAMGTHGRTGLTHVLLGSVAEKVVRHASCPVLAAHVRD
jgi:nucleotide-binding universal stress UspA family protein